MAVRGRPGPLTLETSGHPLRLCCPDMVAPRRSWLLQLKRALVESQHIKIPLLGLGSHISDAQWVVQTWKAPSITESSVGQRPLACGADMGVCDLSSCAGQTNSEPMHSFHFLFLLALPQLPKIW